MAKKTNEATPEPLPDEERQSTTRIYSDLLGMANQVARYRKRKDRNASLLRYLDTILRPVIVRDYQAMIEEEHKKGGKKS